MLCDRDLCMPNIKLVRKGGVAIFYNVKHSQRVSPLCINNDRIIGIQYQCSEDLYMYIFQVYLPSSKQSISKYKEYMEKLSSDKGVVVPMGDINAHISSRKFTK